MLENIASRLTDQLYLHCSLAPAKKVIYGNTAQKSKHDTARHDIIKIWINR